MSETQELISSFKANGWGSDPFTRMLRIAKEDRDSLIDLVVSILKELPKGGTFLDAALSFLTEEEFSHAIDVSLTILQADGLPDAAESVIAYGSQQFPQLLGPHLPILRNLRPNSGTYYEYWPWRGATATEISALKGIIDDETFSPPDRKYAWHCLVNTRDSDAMLFAADHFKPLGIAGNRGPTLPSPDLNAFLNFVGFEYKSTVVRCLHAEQTSHLLFPPGFFDDASRPVWLSHDYHPTWNLEAAADTSALFGGTIEPTCAVCGGCLHRLIQFERVPDFVPVSGRPKLVLASCLSCLGWEEEVLYYEHDDAGLPNSIAFGGSKHVPEFPAESLRCCQIGLALTPPRWIFQDWAASNSRENLNRIGGSPSWIQDADYPSCPRCRSTMPFVAQFDSDLPTENCGEWLWGSGGICYVHWCDSCSISAFLWQCT